MVTIDFDESDQKLCFLFCFIHLIVLKLILKQNYSNKVASEMDKPA
jgi:hypothetical protein